MIACPQRPMPIYNTRCFTAVAATQAQGRCVGGWARISTEVKSLRRQAAREGAAFWFLDAGDEFTGSLWDVVYQGQITPLMQKKVKQDAMVGRRLRDTQHS